MPHHYDVELLLVDNEIRIRAVCQELRYMSEIW